RRKNVAGVLEQLNDAFAGILNSVSASVVQVRDESRGAGAGTIWHSEGLIVTNAHVVHHGPFQVALYDGRVLDAKLIARDEQHDLAALAVEANDLPTIQLGSTRNLHAGQWVMALGHPWGIANAATSGVLIRVGRHAELPAEAGDDWVVADLHLRPGNSGGPLIDAQGRLIGVNTLMTGPGVGVAVSVDAVKEFLKRALGSAAAEVVEPNAAVLV
ncbi:MAG: trypsin-like peptidase domain-containing protein, partial [Chloroflexota bacterium]